MTIFLHLAYIQLCSSTPWEYCCDPGKKIPKAVCNLIVYVMWIVWFLQNTRWTLRTMDSEPFVGKSAPWHNEGPISLQRRCPVKRKVLNMQKWFYYTGYLSACFSVSCQRCAIAPTDCSKRCILEARWEMQWHIVSRTRRDMPMGDTCSKNTFAYSKLFFWRQDIATMNCWVPT